MNDVSYFGGIHHKKVCAYPLFTGLNPAKSWMANRFPTRRKNKKKKKKKREKNITNW